MIGERHRTLEELVRHRLAEGGGPSLHRVHRARSPYSTSAPIDDITVVLTDGSSLHLVGKNLAPEAMLPGARQFKPAFHRHAGREAVVYAHLGGEAGLPQCWGVVDEADGPLLVLERVPGLALRHVGDPSVWRAAAEWLAGFHRRWQWPAVVLPDALLHPLVSYDRSHHERLLARATSFAARAGRSLPPGVVEQHGHALDILEALPSGLMHGEFYASNIVVDTSVTPPRVAALDWETAGLGSQILDLAALVSGKWAPGERKAMIDAYRRESSLDLRADDFERAVAAADLLVSVQWIGWATGWHPPADLAQDWGSLAEASAAILEGSSRPGRRNAV